MAYNLTNLTDAGGFASFYSFSNEVTGGLFGLLVLVAAFMIMMVILMGKTNDFPVSLSSSAFTVSLLALLGRLFGLVDLNVLTGCFVVLALSLFLLYLRSD